jgi:hypothetical protein
MEANTFHLKTKRMKQLILFASLFLALGTQAQKTIHDNNAQSRPAKNFHAIEMSDGIDLYLTQSNEESVAVSASDVEYRDKIRVEVRNGILKIYYDKEHSWGVNWGNRKLKAYVSVKNIDRLSAAGGADVSIENELKVTELKMDLSGGSDFKGTVKTQTLGISASGGSDVDIAGRTEKVDIVASGGSDVNAYDLSSDYCSVSSSGGSDVHITAHKEIKGTASGGSDIYYKGNAVSSASKSGGSSIKRVS